MDRVDRWFVALLLIGPLHMFEQMMTSVEEFHMLRGSLGGYYAMFSPDHADVASVGLITVAWTVASVLIHLAMRGGRSRLVVAGLFGAFALTELHHVTDALGKGGYDAGLMTCVPYAIGGMYLLKATTDAWTQRAVTFGVRTA
jgi:hypothetical protein